MNPKSLLVFLVVLMAGVLGGAAAYQFAVPASSADPAAREALVIDQGDRAGKNKDRRPQFAPCRKPAKLEGNKCVTDEVRTVVVAGSSAPARPAAPAPVPVDTSHGDDEGRHHGGEGEEGHHGDDDDDDGDDHHGGDDDSHTDTDTRSTVSADTGTSTRTRSHD